MFAHVAASEEKDDAGAKEKIAAVVRGERNEKRSRSEKRERERRRGKKHPHKKGEKMNK